LTVLKLEKVSKTFYSKTAETEAIKDCSFTVEKGEFVALLGPSGCGKTTLLSLISGILPLSGGSIYINSQGENKVGYMLQHDHLFEWRTIYKNVVLGLEIQKKLTEENLSRAVALLKKYGLGEFIDRYPNQLSGGMRQRVALIRTLALDPEILLLDEPFSALDFQTRLKVCDDVYSIIKGEGKTTLLVTHDISEAISLGDRILVLSPRPATIAHEHIMDMSHISSPLKRREYQGFAAHFDKIWQELNK
jgi:NitT/TauT family transport system ATP-binding protein